MKRDSKKSFSQAVTTFGCQGSKSPQLVCIRILQPCPQPWPLPAAAAEGKPNSPGFFLKNHPVQVWDILLLKRFCCFNLVFFNLMPGFIPKTLDFLVFSRSMKRCLGWVSKFYNGSVPLCMTEAGCFHQGTAVQIRQWDAAAGRIPGAARAGITSCTNAAVQNKRI